MDCCAQFLPLQRHSGQFYFEELECYVFYKVCCYVMHPPMYCAYIHHHTAYLQSLQSYQNVSTDAVVTPPWCLCVRAHGHTFDTNAQTFLPKLVPHTHTCT